MLQPLPILVYPSVAENGTVTQVDDREIGSWRDALIVHIKAWAGVILSATDWVVVKSVETGQPADAEILTHRQLVRATTNAAEVELFAATTLAEIDAVDWSQAMAALDTTQDAFVPPGE